jgi:hypothetical protein
MEQMRADLGRAEAYGRTGSLGREELVPDGEALRVM